LEEPQGGNLTVEDGDTVVVRTHPYEIVTVQVNYPEQASGREFDAKK
jgi:hypothetical protein